MPNYRARVADIELAAKMRAVGAVLIEGPKACGKTTTVSRAAAAVFDMDRDTTARASIELNPAYLFDQPTPILFDEWQVTPELWNQVRRAVDDSSRGLYLLTRSATPRQDVNRHSGAGRIGTLRMRPMSLFESGHSNGDVSLTALLDGAKQLGKDNCLTVPDLMQRIVIGGWPALLDADEGEARGWIEDYLRQIVEVDIPTFVGRRDPRTLRRVSWHRSVASSHRAPPLAPSPPMPAARDGQSRPTRFTAIWMRSTGSACSMTQRRGGRTCARGLDCEPRRRAISSTPRSARRRSGAWWARRHLAG